MNEILKKIGAMEGRTHRVWGGLIAENVKKIFPLEKF